MRYRSMMMSLNNSSKFVDEKHVVSQTAVRESAVGASRSAGAYGIVSKKRAE